MGMHKYINVPYRIKMEAFSWVAQQFVGLGSFTFPHTCLLSDFHVLRIIYSSSAFSNCVFLCANNAKFLGFKLIFFFLPCLLETFLDLILAPNLVGPLFDLNYIAAFQIGSVNEISSNILH